MTGIVGPHRHDCVMPSQSKYIAESIDRPAADVYAFVSDPANLPEWAQGLGTAVENVGGQWFVDTAQGRVAVAFAQPNEFGILDHDVTLASGETVYNPMRVIADGNRSEVVFTVRRLAGMSDDEFDRDAGLVAADLARLKRVLEDG
jgi:hypothetical protein